ncbi:TonB-dependent receptor plug domain-containing protein [Methylobacterium aquaticum]|uniref:TonB-dependent receptor plug domain-containing protein n=1 Tax=Methylobacterium aquaticum TaxID=270351 RepID=UPI001FEDE3E7|nr:TonB-dependent receptor [Methylobacterium aquaticum]
MPHSLQRARLSVLALSCAGPALLAAPAAHAQQVAAPFADVSQGGEAVIPLAEISVSATGVPTPVTQTGSSVTVLTSDLLQAQQVRTAPDALRQVPGLNVVQTGGAGGQTSVFIRGTNSNHVKVLIDGIDVNDPSTPNRSFDFSQLQTEHLSRLEVLRGPQSGLYGADAIGGVISFVTKRGEGPARATAFVEGGSYGTANQGGRISGSEGIFDYSFSVQHLRQAALPVTPFELLPVGVPLRTAFTDIKTVSTKLGAQLTDTFRLNYVLRFSDSAYLDQADGGFPYRPTPYRNLNDQQQLLMRGEAEWTPLPGFHNVFGANYSKFDRLFAGPLDPLAPPTPSTYLGERTRFDYRGDVQLAPGHLLLFGAQREDERFQATGIDKSNGNTGGFTELQSAITDRAFLVANIRHDENDQFGGATTFRIAPSYILPYTETRLKGSVGTGFKPPTLSQLYQDYPGFRFFGNPALRPEESFGFDGGFEQPLGDRVLVGATYFETDFRNLIQTAYFPTFGTNVNVGRAVAYGAESFVSVKLTDTLSGRVDYTNTVTKDEIAHQELLRRPRHKVSATAIWNPLPQLTLTGTLVAIGSFVDGNRDFSVPRLKNPGFTLVNLSANYAYSENLTLFARIDNLFDQRYQNPTGFLGAGLAVYGGVRVSSF